MSSCRSELPRSWFREGFLGNSKEEESELNENKTWWDDIGGGVNENELLDLKLRMS